MRKACRICTAPPCNACVAIGLRGQNSCESQIQLEATGGVCAFRNCGGAVPETSLVPVQMQWKIPNSRAQLSDIADHALRSGLGIHRQHLIMPRRTREGLSWLRMIKRRSWLSLTRHSTGGFDAGAKGKRETHIGPANPHSATSSLPR